MIRDFEEKDKAAFFEMADAFYHSDAVLHTVDPAYFVQTFSRCVAKDPYVRGLLYEAADGTPAAYCLLALTYSNEVGGLVVWIEEVYVKDKYRGQGLGSALLRHVHELYRDAARFRLEVTAENTGAIALYKRLGYQMLDYLQMSKEHS